MRNVACVVLLVKREPDPSAPPGRASAEAADGPSLRMLEVLEGVCRLGPVTLADLVGHLGIPRGAVWRALAVLRQKGRVRRRSGDNA